MANNFLINDANSGRPSNSKTWFSLVSAVVLFKFAFAGMTVMGTSVGAFDAEGAAFLIAAFGGVYGWRAQQGKPVGNPATAQQVKSNV